jgi:hypothetical protein
MLLLWSLSFFVNVDLFDVMLMFCSLLLVSCQCAVRCVRLLTPLHQRVHEIMEDLLAPSTPYFRLQPMGPPFAARLDEIRKSELLKLQQETRVWIEENIATFNSLCDILLEKKPPESKIIIWPDDEGSRRSESDEKDDV